MAKGPIAVAPCETCDNRLAPFGFEIHYLDESGALATVRLFFCREHREDGERLLAISNEAHGTGHASRPRLQPDPQPAPVPSQGSFDL